MDESDQCAVGLLARSLHPDGRESRVILHQRGHVVKPGLRILYRNVQPGLLGIIFVVGTAEVEAVLSQLEQQEVGTVPFQLRW